MAQSRISDLTAGTPPVPANSLFEISVVNAASPSGYDSRRFTLSDIFGSYLPLGPTLGGTGVTSYVQGDLLFASAANVLSKLPKNTTATRYLSNAGTNNAPVWGQINLANGVSGLLPVTSGGTGSNNFPIPTQWGFHSMLIRGQGTNPVMAAYTNNLGMIGVWNDNTIGLVAANTLGESGIDFGRSRGTITAPSAVLSGDFLGSLWFDGYGATRWHVGSTAQISCIATQNFTDTAQGSSFHFMVTPSGTVGIQDIMQLDGSGLHLSNNISVIDAIPAAADSGTITSHHLTSWELNFNIFATAADPIRINAGFGGNLWMNTADGTLYWTSIPNGAAGASIPWSSAPSRLYITASGQVVLANIAGTSTLALYDDGSSHIESYSALWLNANGNPIYTGGDINTGTHWVYTQNCMVSAAVVCDWQVMPSANNVGGVGQSSQAWAQMNSYWFNTVSGRDKKQDIQTIDHGALKQVEALRSVSFRWKEQPLLDGREERAKGPSKLHWGFIADEVAKVFGEDWGGYSSTKDKDGNKHEGIAYNELVAVLWSAVQELSARVVSLESR